MAEAPPFDYDPTRAAAMQPLLKTMLTRALAACKELYDR
jgi:hypothetical protein